MQEYINLIGVASRKLAIAQARDEEFCADDYVFILGVGWQSLTWNDMIPNHGGVAHLMGIRVVWNEFDKNCIEIYRRVE